MYSKSIHLILFFMAMAMLESAVVIYLRELYYPQGFVFPLKGMKDIIILTELARETATIIMLWTIAHIAGHSSFTRFAWFVIGFGIWDIFYYVFLYLFINWPSSLFEWDILFLIPLPWYGPVIAPCIISLLMIAFGISILRYDSMGKKLHWSLIPSSLMLTGCIIALYSFVFSFWNQLELTSGDTWASNTVHLSQIFVPESYNYPVFGLGILSIILGLIFFHIEYKS